MTTLTRSSAALTLETFWAGRDGCLADLVVDQPAVPPWPSIHAWIRWTSSRRRWPPAMRD
jgi:hypothetical protein